MAHVRGSAPAIGKLALLLGALAAIVTTYALVAKRRKEETVETAGAFEGWEEFSGM